jgi:hypothetical protein
MQGADHQRRQKKREQGKDGGKEQPAAGTDGQKGGLEHGEAAERREQNYRTQDDHFHGKSGESEVTSLCDGDHDGGDTDQEEERIKEERAENAGFFMGGKFKGAVAKGAA